MDHIQGHEELQLPKTLLIPAMLRSVLVVWNELLVDFVFEQMAALSNVPAVEWDRAN